MLQFNLSNLAATTRYRRLFASFLIASLFGLILPTYAVAQAPSYFNAYQSGAWTSPYTWFRPDSDNFGYTPGTNSSVFVSRGWNDHPVTVTASSLTIGAAGNGYLDLFSGGSVAVSTSVVLASLSGSSGNISVSSTGSSLSAQSLTIGAAGSGYLTVSSGGTASWNRLYLAVQPGSQGTAIFSGVNLNLDTIDFTGNGSATLRMGWEGWGTANSPVTATTSAPVVLGGSSGSSGSIFVSGTGSSLSAQSLTIGGAGTGLLTVSNGGVVTADTVVVGRDALPPWSYTSGGISVSGAGSSMSAQSLTIGAAGSGSLTVSSGGVVTADTVVVGQDAPVSSGSYSGGGIFVSGATLSAQLLTIGAAGNGSLDVSNGGVVTAYTVVVGRDVPALGSYFWQYFRERSWFHAVGPVADDRGSR
jgi:T5SS/PEP-CTERM-associated repeat protein